MLCRVTAFAMVRDPTASLSCMYLTLCSLIIVSIELALIALALIAELSGLSKAAHAESQNVCVHGDLKCRSADKAACQQWGRSKAC